MQLRGFRHGMQSRGDEIRRGVGAGRSLLCRLHAAKPTGRGGGAAACAPKGAPPRVSPLCIASTQPAFGFAERASLQGVGGECTHGVALKIYTRSLSHAGSR
jgi:hypothetical protein